ncbi:COBRA-like protein 1 [Camellia lanceoleosa]|uniref:COBRA-like protein 1 n=1 Tax=Camellia lanceoleosa TaxID=1840588 RepID=A0ACC0IE51_9ERIC|nr:COBRA-like protein 1 [Camellia lanceoleosa]
MIYSDKIDPVIVDLLPDAANENKSSDCCRGGLLSAWAINRLQSFSSFEITVGHLEGNTTGYIPLNLTLMAPGPGYTCGQLKDTDPTVSSVIGGRRQEQGHGNHHAHTLVTWLTKRQFVVFPTQHSTILSSHHALSASVADHQIRIQRHALGENIKGNPVTQSDLASNPDIVQCTDHMCPLRVHWRLKNNYKDQWRVKLTISNYNYGKSYSDWNVVVQHPGFSQSAITYSFNSTVLPTVGITDEIALFWGLEHYNSQLLTADEKQPGSVTTEVLLEKDSKSFTLRNGWAFPRRIYFSGDNCEMPLPDTFPMLPNGSSSQKPTHHHFILLFLIILTLKTLLV